MIVLAPILNSFFASLHGLLMGTTYVSHMTGYAAAVLATSLWQGTLLAFAVWMLLRFLPGISAAVRFAIWASTFAFVVLLPFLGLHRVSSRSGTNLAPFHLDARWSLAIASVWAIASIVHLVRLSIGVVRLREIWRRAEPLSGCEAPAFVAGRRVQICASRDVDRPCVIGFFYPRVLIPADVVSVLSANELQHIILHETSHLRRRDDWMNLLQKLVLVAMPLNPVLVWVERRMCLERELACDDSVIACTRAPRTYARCLTNLAEMRVTRHVAALSLAAWGRRPELSRRVESILSGGWSTSPRRVYVAASAAFAVILTGVAALSHCPQLVAFTNTSASHALIANSSYEKSAPHTSRPQTTLVKAMMPVAAHVPTSIGDGVGLPSRVTYARKAKRSRMGPALLRTSAATRGSQAAPTPTRAVMVFDAAPGFVPAGMILTVSGDGRLTRAVVPTSDGWLVLQL